MKDLENLKSSLEDEIEKMKIDARKSEAEIAKQVDLVNKKKAVEEEMMATIKGIDQLI